MPDVTLDKKMIKHLSQLADMDSKATRKAIRAFEEMSRDPLSGSGKLEKLKGRPDTYSRRLDEKNRIVFKYTGGGVTVLDILGHYDDN